MDELERALRGVLTDERLDVPLRHGAVTAIHAGVRRRNRRRAIATATVAAVAILGAGTVAVVATRSTGDGRETVLPGEHSPSNSTAPTSPPSSTTGPVPAPTTSASIEWAPLPAGAFAVPGSVADPSVPWCDAHGVSVSVTEFQGATGSAAGGLVAVNHGAACALQGPPAVVGYDAGDKAIALPAPPDDFILHRWWVLRAGQRADSSVQIFGDGSRCRGDVARLQVDIGHGAPMADASPHWVGGGGVAPRCGTVPAAQQLDHYVVSAGDWARPGGSPSLPAPDVTVGLQDEPPTVMQGTIFRYKVLMTGTPSLHPCTPYRERLVSLGTGTTVLAEEEHSLNCQAIRDAGDVSSYLLQMQLAVPTTAPPGDANLEWETPLPGQAASDGPAIRIVAAPPACAQPQLAITSGHMGAAAGSYYGRVIITNTSARACSLRGYPGVQFVDSAGQPVTTDARRDTTTAVQTVTLAAHGGAASFLVSGSDFTPPGGARPCAGTEGLRVIAPNLTTQVLVRGIASNCQHGYIRVYPVVPGRHPTP